MTAQTDIRHPDEDDDFTGGAAGWATLAVIAVALIAAWLVGSRLPDLWILVGGGSR